MAESLPPAPPDPAGDFGRQVGAKAARRLKARRQREHTVWFGLGMMGLVGWSVAIPTLAGIGIGWWLDAHHPAGHSWVLALLPVGLVLGCASAWHWVSREGRVIRSREEDGDE